MHKADRKVTRKLEIKNAHKNNLYFEIIKIINRNLNNF